MNKLIFLKEVSFKSDLPLNTCRKVFDNMYLVLRECLNKGHVINFQGFGKFYVKTKGERIIKVFGNEKTLVESKNIPVFKMGKSFKNIIR